MKKILKDSVETMVNVFAVAYCLITVSKAVTNFVGKKRIN